MQADDGRAGQAARRQTTSLIFLVLRAPFEAGICDEPLCSKERIGQGRGGEGGVQNRGEGEEGGEGGVQSRWEGGGAEAEAEAEDQGCRLGVRGQGAGQRQG
jgi:hypothetical protein